MILCDVQWYCAMCSDTVWCAVILCDVQWYCVMCSNAVWCEVILCDVQWYCEICSDTLRCAVILCDVKWYCEVWNVTVRCAVIRCAVILCDVQLYSADRSVLFLLSSTRGIFWQFLIFSNFTEGESFLKRAFSTLLSFIQDFLFVTSVITAIIVIHRTNTAHCCKQFTL